MQNLKVQCILLSTIICIAFLPSTLATEIDAAQEPQETEVSGIEVIKVSAQKRVESIQEVPIAISAFSAEEINKIGAQNINDLGLYTPGLETNNATATQTAFTIRGITTNDLGIGLDAAVAVYIDGVYVGRRGSSNLNFNDVERVEVLKGPQGTLFGRNAAAGAIHIITKKPEGDNSAFIDFTFGNYVKRKVSFNNDIAINKDWALKTSFTSNHRGGYLDVLDSHKKYANERDWSLRASLARDYADSIEVILRADFNDTNQQARAATTLNTGYGSGDPFAPIAFDFEGREAREAWGVSAEVTWQTSNLNYTSITAYRAFDRFNQMEDDGSRQARAFFTSNLVEDQQQFSQEFRIANQSERFKWTAGLTLFYEDIDQYVKPTFNTLSFDALALVQLGMDPRMLESFPLGQGVAGAYMTFGPPIALQAIAAEIQSRMAGGMDFETAQASVGMDLVNANLDKLFGKHKEQFYHHAITSSVAVYFDSTYAVTDALDLTLGLRYTYDEKRFHLFSEPQNTYNVPFGNVGEVPFGVAFRPEDARQNDNWDKFTPRVVVDYKWNSDIMTYLSYAEGFKSGGFNGLGLAPPIKEETVKNAEAGIKSSWLDNRLRINGAVYQYEYTNLQLLELFGSPVPTYNLRNVNAEGDGFELEFIAQVTPDLIVSANYGKTVAKYTQWSFFEGEDTSTGKVGQSISGMPEHQGNIGLDYYFDALDGQMNLHLNIVSTGERTQGVEGPALSVLPYDPSEVTGLTDDGRISGYELVNTRLKWQSNNHPIYLTFYVSNLLDEQYLIQIGGQGMALGSPIATPGLPRMMGVEFGMEF